MLSVEVKKTLPSRGRESFALDLNFDAPPGVTILFGHSGAGKTSVLRLVAGTWTPDEGRIEIGERVFFDSASGVNLSVQRRRVGYVFQDHALFPHLTAAENVAYGVRVRDGQKMNRNAKRERAGELLSLMSISHVADNYPTQLSGGESQRVALARALASDPSVMLLDEPLSAVDARARAGLIAEMRRLQAETGIPFLYVTHNAAEAKEIGTHVVVLDGGRVTDQGAPREILSKQ